MNNFANSQRVSTIKDIIGQKHLLHNNGIIFKMIQEQVITSLIFYGPAGVGKTTLATTLCAELKIDYDVFNAALQTKSDLTKLLNNNNSTIIIEDIHRMNKNLQDLLLEYIEHGKKNIFLITTENPFFTINQALRSRCNILQLNSIDKEELKLGLKKVIDNNNLQVSSETIDLIINDSNGDLRTCLNKIEIIAKLYKDILVDKTIYEQIGFASNILADKQGDMHYDLLSAFQKSIRGSDVNAALHYMHRLLNNGDYLTLMRRMKIIAYEDIGLANPAIPSRVKTACDIFTEVGLPEGVLPLGTVIIEMALSHKSNSATKAISKAKAAIVNNDNLEIPKHIQDNHYSGAQKLKRGIGYKLPHDFTNNYVEQQYLPNKIKNDNYFEFQNNKYENLLKNIYKGFKQK